MIDRIKLKDFLKKNGCESVEIVMLILEPFFSMTENKVPLLEVVPFLKKEELKAEEIREVLDNFGLKVEKINFIPLKRVFPKPEGMKEYDYQSSFLDERLGVSIWDSLGRDSFETHSLYICSVFEFLGKELYHSLNCSLHYFLTSFLGDFYMRIGAGKTWIGTYEANSFWAGLWGSIWQTLFCFVGFSLANKVEEAEKFKAWLTLLTQCIVTGSEKGEPTTWIVVTA